VADGVVRAFAPAGVKKWTLPIDGTSALSRSSPVIGSDGTLYTSSLFTTLYAITPEGSRKWARPDGCGDALPTPTYEGRVYAYAPTLSALTPAGSNQWSAGGLFGAGPSIGPGGTIYLVEPYGVKLHALSSSGQRLWEAIPVLQTNVPATTPAVDCAGTVYHCTSNAVFALSPQGAVLWTFSSGYPLSLSSPVPQTSPAIGPDGTIYATVGSTLYALYNTNKLANSSWPMFRQNPRRTGSVERPVLKQPQKRSDGGFHFQLYAQPGQALDIQTTADFVTWGSLTNLVVTNPPMDVLDLTASNADLRYYRAASPP
jgi:outer membrane protein assembly factor BamB